eukprot:9118211-Pyramimonas_sp.AAC.1
MPVADAYLVSAAAMMDNEQRRLTPTKCTMYIVQALVLVIKHDDGWSPDVGEIFIVTVFAKLCISRQVGVLYMLRDSTCAATRNR